MVTIADVVFPCVTIICPPHERDKLSRVVDDNHPWHYALPSSETEVWVPCENGLLVHVEEYAVDSKYFRLGLLQVNTWFPWCIEDEEFRYIAESEDAYWTPMAATFVDGTFIPEPTSANAVVRGRWLHMECEPEWVAESIQRWSKKPVDVSTIL